jgi:putative hydroxymethylpyrimidine transport system substrate-binding protein
MITLRPREVAFSVIAACLALSSCSRPSPTSPPQLREIRLRLDWTPWAPHAAFYAAEDQGFFREQGLKVKMYVPPDPETTAKLVATGQDEFGISYMTDTILAKTQGFNVVSLAALINHPLNCIMTLKKSGLDKPSRLAGKTIGSTGVPSDLAFLEGVLSRNGVKRGTYKLVNLGFNLAQALKSGKVDAIVGAYWPWEGLNMEREGYDVNVMKLQEYGVPDYYELVLISRQDLADKDSAMVKSFLSAAVKGQAFVREHPDKAVEILRRASPELKQDFLAQSLETVLPMMNFPEGQFRQEEQTWATMIEFMRTSGLIKDHLAPSSVFTNRFLP